jgi:hypothetical protein
MGWKARHQELFSVNRLERDLYARQDPGSAYRDFQFPNREGIHRRGEFPVAVVRKAYADRGYDCWISAQSRHGVPSYLLERMPRIRRKRDQAYLKMVEVFDSEVLARFHELAAAERRAQALRSAGGDPDLFVERRGDPRDRFFVEVKLEDLTGSRAYRDRLNRQQMLLFPLIERELRCEVRLATVSVQAAQMVGTG